MKRIIAALALAVALSSCSTDVDISPAQTPGKCTQERTQKFLGFIQTNRNQYIVNC